MNVERCAPELWAQGRGIGPAHPCLIVGEVAQAHEGSLGMAHAFIDAVADAGADAVKFQTHIAAAESTPGEPFRVPMSGQDGSRYDYWKRMEFRAEEWRALREHALHRNLLFISSPFSQEAVELLLGCGIEIWKLGSGELGHAPLLDVVARTGLPIILSTGFARWAEISAVVTRLRRQRARVALLQCTSRYPTLPEEVGVQLVPRYRDAFGCPSGLSDHSGTIYPGLIAAALGANIVEVHVTFDRRMYGPDVSASITIDGLRQLAEGIRFVERMILSGPHKDALADALLPERAVFARSIVARRRVPAGRVLSSEDVAFRKPGTGLPPERLPAILGRRVVRDIDEDALLRLEDLAPAIPAAHRIGD